MYEFWCDCVKPKYDEKANLCYMDTSSFITYVKTDDIYKYIAEDVETRVDTSNHELDRLLPKGKNKQVIGLTKYELGRKITTKFAGFKTKDYSYLLDDSSKDKKPKRTKRYHKKKMYIRKFK